MTGPDARITRVRRSRRAARDWYDTVSPWYGWLADPFEREARSRGLELLGPNAGERIADVGCGPGSALVSIARTVGDAGRAVGLDVAAGMCHEARDTVAGAGLSDRVHVVRGDAVQLPFRTDSLDAVFMSFTLELFDTPEIPAVVGECKRALRPGGRLAVVALSRRDAGLATWLYERVHEALPRVVDCRPIYARETLRDAGLEIVAADERRLWGLPVDIVVARM